MRLCLLTLGGFALLLTTAPLVAQDETDNLKPAEPKVVMTEENKKAVEKALAWMANRQQANGSWNDQRNQWTTAITGFAMLAFMSAGNTPTRGEYAPVVAKGARYLLTSVRNDGYLAGPGGNMYCHGMATLALAELWGMTGDEEIRAPLKKAIDLIQGCQSNEGGWRYEPRRTAGADISVTIMQVMALRAARNGGLHVRDEVMKRAIEYIFRCEDRQTGGFRYQPFGGPAGFARTAAAASAILLAGEYEAKQIPRAIEYLKRSFNSREYFWYGHYYAAHAMHTTGGKDWADWYERISQLLLTRQAPSGEWSDRGLDFSAPGPIYQTAIATIILCIPNHYLPIYQR